MTAPGKDQTPMRDRVADALRRRPDAIAVGETRGETAGDLLAALAALEAEEAEQPVERISLAHLSAGYLSLSVDYRLAADEEVSLETRIAHGCDVHQHSLLLPRADGPNGFLAARLDPSPETETLLRAMARPPAAAMTAWSGRALAGLLDTLASTEHGDLADWAGVGVAPGLRCQMSLDARRLDERRRPGRLRMYFELAGGPPGWGFAEMTLAGGLPMYATLDEQGSVKSADWDFLNHLPTAGIAPTLRVMAEAAAPAMTDLAVELAAARLAALAVLRDAVAP